MGYSCKILLDSISETNKRLTTFEITFPRIVLAEFNTHRMFSRNSASSRAIPFSKQVLRVIEDPFIPEQFPINCSGMQPKEYITKNDSEYNSLEKLWIYTRNQAVDSAKLLNVDNIHKQICNRLLEPFMWHTVICTATEFSNFFKLRCDENAQYEIRRIADLMYEAYHFWEDNFQEKQGIENVVPIRKLKVGEWHCPLVYEEDEQQIIKAAAMNTDYDIGYKTIKQIEMDSWNNGSAEELLIEVIEIKKKISVARCARVSYLTHDGKRDIEKDLELFERLKTSGHWSPFEHIATPYFVNHNNTVDKLSYYDNFEDLRSGNFLGWRQYRKEFADENCTNFRK